MSQSFDNDEELNALMFNLMQSEWGLPLTISVCVEFGMAGN